MPLWFFLSGIKPFIYTMLIFVRPADCKGRLGNVDNLNYLLLMLYGYIMRIFNIY